MGCDGHPFKNNISLILTVFLITGHLIPYKYLPLFWILAREDKFWTISRLDQKGWGEMDTSVPICPTHPKVICKLNTVVLKQKQTIIVEKRSTYVENHLKNH